MLKSYPIQIEHKKTNTIYIPSAYHSNQLHIAVFGTTFTECKILPHLSNNNEVKMTNDLFAKLKIPSLGPTHLFVKDETLFLGPLVGIFTAGFTDSQIRPIGERTMLFAKILSVEKAVGGYSFVFGAHHINWEKGTITGLFYRNNGWEKKEVPFPNVIYDRLPNRKTENHYFLRKIKQRLHDEYLIPWYNPGFFNKWEIHQKLKDDKTVARFLPETHEKPTFSLIERMLTKYQHVYLKPANGSLGFGVFQIIYAKTEGAYYCRYKDDYNENKLNKFSSLEALINYLFRNRPFEHYIVQQGISLLRIDHKAVDFRVHCNKNSNGVWEVSAIAGKLSGRGSVTTHLNSGGVVKTLDEIFSEKEELLRMKLIIEQTAITLSHALDHHLTGNIGEIGFDFGIDKTGQIWLFEANSKPGRSIFTHPKLKDFDVRSRTLSLEYAIYLTKKMIIEPEAIV